MHVIALCTVHDTLAAIKLSKGEHSIMNNDTINDYLIPIDNICSFLYKYPSSVSMSPLTSRNQSSVAPLILYTQ